MNDKSHVVTCVLLESKNDLRTFTNIILPSLNDEYVVELSYIGFEESFENDEDVVAFYLEQIEKNVCDYSMLDGLIYYTNYQNDVGKILMESLEGIFPVVTTYGQNAKH